MKLFTIATKTAKCHGHGDFAEEDYIIRMSPYGMGPYPPLFESIKDAEDWLKENAKEFYGQTAIVTMETNK